MHKRHQLPVSDLFSLPSFWSSSLLVGQQETDSTHLCHQQRSSSTCDLKKRHDLFIYCSTSSPASTSLCLQWICFAATGSQRATITPQQLHTSIKSIVFTVLWSRTNKISVQWSSVFVVHTGIELLIEFLGFTLPYDIRKKYLFYCDFSTSTVFNTRNHGCLECESIHSHWREHLEKYQYDSHTIPLVFLVAKNIDLAVFFKSLGIKIGLIYDFDFGKSSVYCP